MPAPQKIIDLVERFERNKEAYEAAQYNETQVRREFIDPLFKALGWDIDNEQGYAEAYKDVIHEDAIRIGGMHKAPDYCMRIGGVRKFFVEAKKPAVNVKQDADPAFQVRRYAWSAKLPLSVLTDFQELAIYDCRIKPLKNDGPAKARIQYFTYKDYIDKWDEIASVFSRDAVLKGSFDKYAEATKQKKGSEEVDEAFLKEIERWRESLAKNIALRNPDLSQRELNFSVQVTIDRLVFLRICEDRGIEDYGRLLAEVNGVGIYGRLKQHFRDADDRYNSGLFHFDHEKDESDTPDTLTLGLQIDDDVLKEIISHLYYPESPYEFSVLSADILGQVYEQFLGKVIRLTDGHRAKIEEKPEVRKAGGVYYTPTYIVQYIVEHTIGKLVEGKSPKEVEKIKICDPACGSGSFLLGAYQFLLDWHLKYYMENDPTKWNKQLTQSTKGDWRLSTAERKRILLNNIFGVDIDAQAVEVTKLSLLLKVLEGETDQSLQRTFIHERVLPNLGSNIKCGNSLIGQDFYTGQQMGMLETEEQYRINVFDWEKAFPNILTGKNPGFDAIIGNPPYIRIQAMKEWAPIEVEYYKKRYASASQGNYDIYVVFMEKCLSLLSKNGLLGFILPHKFFKANYGEPIREIFSKGKHLDQIVYFGHQQVFKGATTYTCLFFASKAPTSSVHIVKAEDLEAWRLHKSGLLGQIEASAIGGSSWNFNTGEGAELLKKLQDKNSTFEEMTDMFVGLQTSADTVFLFKDVDLSNLKNGSTLIVNSKELGADIKIEADLLKPVIRSGSIGRYYALPNAAVFFPYVKEGNKYTLIPQGVFESKFPLAWDYLNKNKQLLSGREHGKFLDTGWYQLYPKNLDLWDRPKILVPYMISRLAGYYDEQNMYFVNVTTGGFGVVMKDGHEESLKYLNALLNSKLLDWYLRQIGTTFQGGYMGANKQFLGQLPIRKFDFSKISEKEMHEKVISMTEKLQKLKTQMLIPSMPHQKEMLEREFDAIDDQLDKLIYELYELTDSEIQIIESSFASKDEC